MMASKSARMSLNRGKLYEAQSDTAIECRLPFSGGFSPIREEAGNQENH
jgi:hypothetical protein